MAERSVLVARAGTSTGSVVEYDQINDEPVVCVYPPPLHFSLYCPYCNIFFHKMYDMVLHEYTKHKGIDNPFKCNDCEEVFETTDDFTYHMAHHDQSDTDQYEESDLDDSDVDLDYVESEDSESPELEMDRDWQPNTQEVTIVNKVQTWVCGQCLKKFDTKKEKMMHTAENGGQCTSSDDFSSAVTMITNLRESHKTTDSDETQFVCNLDGCQKSFKSSKSFKEHKRKVHRDRNQYKCNICEFATNEMLRLIWHKSSHDDRRRFKCQYDGCEYCALSERDVNYHEQRIHRKIKVDKSSKKPTNIYRCKHCFYDTTKIRDYNKHQKEHKKYGVGPLPQTQVSDNNKDCIVSPIKLKKVNGILHRKYICEWPTCLHRFNSQILLQQHKLSHEDRFVCRWPQCTFRANTLAKLNDHRRKENHLKVAVLEPQETPIVFIH